MEFGDGRFWCGLVRNPSSYLDMPAFGDPVVGAIFAQALGVGRGCDSDAPGTHALLGQARARDRELGTLYRAGGHLVSVRGASHPLARRSVHGPQQAARGPGLSRMVLGRPREEDRDSACLWRVCAPRSRPRPREAATSRSGAWVIPGACVTVTHPAWQRPRWRDLPPKHPERHLDQRSRRAQPHAAWSPRSTGERTLRLGRGRQHCDLGSGAPYLRGRRHALAAPGGRACRRASRSC